MRRRIVSLVLIFMAINGGGLFARPSALASNAPVCAEAFGLPWRVGGKVKADYLVSCNRTVNSITVTAYLTRTKANGVIIGGGANSNTCASTDHCRVTATIDYVQASGDLYHVWGQATIVYTKNGVKQRQYIDQNRSPLCADCNNNSCAWV